MLDKKLTDEEIRLTLFLCANGLCEACPYQMCIGCHEDLLTKVGELIDRYKAENKKLKTKEDVDNENKT